MVVISGITVAGYYKVQPLPLQTLPFAQLEIGTPDLTEARVPSENAAEKSTGRMPPSFAIVTPCVSFAFT